MTEACCSQLLQDQRISSLEIGILTASNTARRAVDALVLANAEPLPPIDAQNSACRALPAVFLHSLTVSAAAWAARRAEIHSKSLEVAPWIKDADWHKVKLFEKS
jgi:hypothetical protein